MRRKSTDSCDIMAIEIRLDHVLLDKKMTLIELSRKVGVSPVNLSRLKTGKVNGIRFSTLDAICEALGCQPGDIIRHVGNDDEESEL